LFPGQGAQAVGMAGDWVAEHPAAARLFARGSEILGYDLLELCRSGPAERLNTTAVSQPAILVTSLAALEVQRARDPAPLDAATMTAGLSLGEYTALGTRVRRRGPRGRRTGPGDAGLRRGGAERDGGRARDGTRRRRRPL
jgi:malonyl CoA-acyl carrier protein transacylase